MAAQAAFVDFAQLKDTVSIGQVAQMLGLKLTQKGNQSRGPCPACQQGGDRALAVNTDGRWYCFSAKKGGDSISLAAHITGKSQRDAAQQIATHFRFAGGTEPAAQPPAQTRKPAFDAEAYLKGLDPAASQLSELGISPETLNAWRAGYAKGGVLRGRLAVGLVDGQGSVLGFVGIALANEAPRLLFPGNFDPRSLIFGADHVTQPEVRFLKDPLEVIKSSEFGEEALCFLTESWNAQQSELLAVLQHEKGFEVF